MFNGLYIYLIYMKCIAYRSLSLYGHYEKYSLIIINSYSLILISNADRARLQWNSLIVNCKQALFTYSILVTDHNFVTLRSRYMY